MTNKQRKCRGGICLYLFRQCGRCLTQPNPQNVQFVCCAVHRIQPTLWSYYSRASHELTSSSLSPIISPTHYSTTLPTLRRVERYIILVGDWTDRAWCLGERRWLLSLLLIFRESRLLAISELLVIALLASCPCWLARKRSSFEWSSDLLLDTWCPAFVWYVLPWLKPPPWRCSKMNLMCDGDTVPYFVR